MDTQRENEIARRPEIAVGPAPESEPTIDLSPGVAAQEEAVGESAAMAPLPSTEPQEKGSARVKTVLEQEIDSVLEEDIGELFWNLPEAERVEFRQRGEDVGAKIKELLSQAVVKVQEVFKLIADWLKTLPRVSTFYVEQESKIKTDKILKLKR